MLELDKIYNMDCLEGMKQIDNNSIDMILCDAPYGIKFNRAYRKETIGITGDDAFDVMFFIDDLLVELQRTLKEGGAFYWFTRYDVYPYMYIKIKRYFTMKNQIIWYKGIETTGMGDRKGNYANNYESIIFCVKGRHILKDKICGSMWSIKSEGNKLHPTQKPLELVNKIIRFSSEVGDVVLDCFIGSGTTALACRQLNRHFIGFEINKDYYNICLKRLLDQPKRLDSFNKMNNSLNTIVQ